MTDINLDDLTIGQVKEISSLLGIKEEKSEEGKIFKGIIGKYVLIRSRNEGVNAGFLTEASEKGCVLFEARRLWEHKPKDKNLVWYEGVAESGLDKSSKLSGTTAIKVIIENYSITLCSEKAEKSIRDFPVHSNG